VRSWKRPVAWIVGIAITVDLLMVLTDMGPNVPLVAALCLLIGFGVWFFAGLGDLVPMTDVQAAATPPTERTDRRVMRLRTGLVFGRHDDTSLDRLWQSLVELVDDQLRAAHHIDRLEDPDAARAVLGADLFAFVGDPTAANQLGRPRELDRILTLIEQI
jgi:hypothetical protein